MARQTTPTQELQRPFLSLFRFASGRGGEQLLHAATRPRDLRGALSMVSQYRTRPFRSFPGVRWDLRKNELLIIFSVFLNLWGLDKKGDPGTLPDDAAQSTTPASKSQLNAKTLSHLFTKHNTVSLKKAHDNHDNIETNRAWGSSSVLQEAAARIYWIPRGWSVFIPGFWRV